MVAAAGIALNGTFGTRLGFPNIFTGAAEVEGRAGARFISRQRRPNAVDKSAGRQRRLCTTVYLVTDGFFSTGLGLIHA